jgi:hypothetical protein
MRRLFWIDGCQSYTEVHTPKVAEMLANSGCIDVTGDLEDERAAAHQFTGEPDDDALQV